MPDTPRSSRDRIVVRPVKVADSEAVAKLVSELGYETDATQMRGRLSEILADTSYATFVAEHEGAVVGTVGVRIGSYYERSGMYGQLLVLSVSEGIRGRGVGRALVDTAEEWARERGASAMVVHSGQQREEAHAFYEGVGYSRTGLRFVRSLKASQ
jgi:GNAT superfamily N-acetyltransferase